MEHTIVFLGDSLTEWGNWQELFPEKNIVNCGIAGDTTVDILSRLEPVIQHNPMKLFLLAGINDFGNGKDTEAVFTNYQKIVSLLVGACPTLKIYLLSVLPVNPDRFFNPLLDDRKIAELNTKIEKLALTDGYVFIDMHTSFLGANGGLDDELSPDGLHLNNDGYLLWKSLIEKYL